MTHSFVEEALEDVPANLGADVEMAEGAGDGATTHANGSELPFAETGPDDPPAPRISFVQYLATPIVTLLIGGGDSEHVLTAHQGLLSQSTYFAEHCAEFTDDGSVRLHVPPPELARLTLACRSPAQSSSPAKM